MKINLTKILFIGMLFLILSLPANAIKQKEVIGTIYDKKNPVSTEEKWFVCPYTGILEDQFAVYKSMEHVNWISIEKIKGRGKYCPTGEGLENPGIVQKIDLWRQRINTYMSSEELRPYYDSQVNPKRALDDRDDESRMALLDWLFTTRVKMQQCVTGYSAAHNKDSFAKIRMFGCQEGMTATDAQGYRITPDFPYPANNNGPNCFPLNAEYLTKTEKEMCDRNMNYELGCQKAINKEVYIDDFYCTSGRQQTSK